MHHKDFLCGDGFAGLSMHRPGVTPPARRYSTPGFAGYNVAWSPFFPGRLAVATSANVRMSRLTTQYGLVGNGRLWLFGPSPAQVKMYV